MRPKEVAFLNTIYTISGIMFSIGKTAKILGLLGNGVTKILGIPLSATGKNKYFDLGAFHKS